MRRAALAGLLIGAASASAASISVAVVDQDKKPVEDAVAFVYDHPGRFTPPSEPIVMDQIDQEFVPHLIAILAGSKVRFPNKDDIQHHLYSFSETKTFEIQLYKGEPADPVRFEKPGVVKLGCNIHDWMSGVILVLPNPYFVKTGKDGKASLALPGEAGLKIALFHERLKGSVDSTLKPASRTLSWQVTLKPFKKKERRPVKYP